MLYTLIVKPILLAALAGVLLLVWRAGSGLAPAEARRHRRWVGLAATAIALLVLGPPAWAALTEQPGEVLRWGAGVAVSAVLVILYARWLADLRGRAKRSDLE